MEVCVDSVESALNAARGGASRLEICSSLEVGGLTPSPGLVSVVSTHVSIPCFAMIRPRAGDFVYSELEVEVMEYDVEELLDCGAKGLVFGCLDSRGELDLPSLRRLIRTAMNKRPGVELTFHRALDMSRDILRSAKTVQSLGFVRILTSGGRASVLEGADVIEELRRELADCTVMPGGGVTEENMQEVMERTRCVEFHASARVKKDSVMKWRNKDCSMGSSESSEFSTMVTSTSRVEALVRIYKNNILEIQK